MTNIKPMVAGVIEGFFGRSWSWQNRRDLAPFLKEQGLDFYLYAPKGDKHLRSQWRQPHPPAQWRELSRTREVFSRCAIDLGIGLSPLDLCAPDGAADTSALDNKIKQLNTLQLDYLALLFDDMRGELPDLAERQSTLANHAAAQSNAKRILLCPTYYSTDPVLEKVFGKAPDNYLEQLGRHLHRDIDVFWTGPKVCSDSYPKQHLEEITTRLGRKPFLWDNYPVNDGAVRSQHLYLAAPGSERAAAKGLVSGIAANPMNQFAASLPALAGLGCAVSQDKYDCEATTAKLFTQMYPKALADQLLKDAPTFAQVKLSDMSETQKHSLMTFYSSWRDEALIAEEVYEWLQGGYEFDPNCLTE